MNNYINYTLWDFNCGSGGLTRVFLCLALPKYNDVQLRDVAAAFSGPCCVIGWLPRGIHRHRDPPVKFADLGLSTPDLGKPSSTYLKLAYV